MAFTTNVIGRLRDFATDELLWRIGLQQRPSTFERVLPSAGIFAGGVLVGIGIGLLFAPRSGAETRASIREGAAKVGNRAKEIYGNVMMHAEEPVEEASDSMGGTASHAAHDNGKARGSNADKRVSTQRRVS